MFFKINYFDQGFFMLSKKRFKKKEKWKNKKFKQNQKLNEKHKSEMINKHKMEIGIERSINNQVQKSKYQHIDDLNIILSEIEKTVKKSEKKRDATVFNYLYSGIDSMFKSLDELEDSFNSWQGDF